MQKGLLDLHHTLFLLILLFMLWTLVKTVGGLNGKKPFLKSDKRPAMFLMICCDIQLLLGLVLYSMRGWTNVLMNGTAMSSKYSRYWSVEHAAGMLIAIIFVHIGYSAAKKNIADGAKYKRVFWFTLIALIAIAATAPWPWRAEVGRPLLLGM